MEPTKPNPKPNDERIGPSRPNPSPNDDRRPQPDDEKRPKDDNPARRTGKQQEDLPQADGDSTDAGDANVEDAAKDAGLK